LVASCFYQLSDDSFELLLYHTIHQNPSSLTITNIDLISIDKLKIIWGQFPKSINEHAINCFLDSDSCLDDLEKFAYILKRGMKLKNRNFSAVNNNSVCLLPHMALTYILHATPPRKAGFHAHSHNHHFMKGLSMLTLAPTIIDRLAEKVPSQFKLVDANNRTCMGVLLSNLDHLLCHPDQSWIVPLIRSLLRAHPPLIDTPCVSNGRLPIHVAIAKGFFFYTDLLRAAPQTIEVPCPVTKFLPFQLASSSSSNSSSGSSNSSHWWYPYQGNGNDWRRRYSSIKKRSKCDAGIEMTFSILVEGPHLVQPLQSSSAKEDEDRKKKLALLDLKVERMRIRHRRELEILEGERSKC